MAGTTAPVKFRCTCGRSVVTQPGTTTADTHRCSRCTERDLRRFDDLRRD